jgi:transposase-like protein
VHIAQFIAVFEPCAKIRTMGRKHHSESERKEILRLLGQKTCTLKQFASDHGITIPTIYQWQKKQHPAMVDQGVFVEIDRPEPIASTTLCLRHQCVELNFESLPDANWLATLLQRLAI